jgi:beta-lactamase class A
VKARSTGCSSNRPKAQTSSLDDALRRLRPAQGELSYVVIEGRSERAVLSASAPLAVGSAFKLAVLAALRDEVSAGLHRWDEVIPLDPRAKSLPSGVLARWPDGLPLTLATYAAQMISISDNSAADELIGLAGPVALARYAGSNAPFLTPREMFVLKSDEGRDLRRAYPSARTPEARSAVLAQADTLALPPPATLAASPILAIEWHFSVRDLCGLMGRVADLPLMSINPGPADAASFRHVAYKGGSDTGVINMTTAVTTKQGTEICFSATVNDRSGDVDGSAFELAYGTVLSALATR